MATENRLLNVNFKGFMAKNGHANGNDVRLIYDEGDSSLPMVSCECTCLVH